MKRETMLHTVALLTLLTITAYCIADAVDAMIGHRLEAATKFASPLDQSSAGPAKRSLGEYSSILERGLFGDGSGSSSGPSITAATSYTLIGTVEGALFSGAVLADKSGQTFYRINQKLPDGSSLVKIMRTKITLRKPDGSTVDIETADDAKIVPLGRNDAGSGVKKLSDGKFMVDQREVLASTENMSKILTQARALPYMEHGKTVGFRISEIVPNSIYTKIGLQNGDVIQKVNSQDIDDPAKFFQLYQGLQNEKTIAIDLLRGGQHQTLNYEIR